MNTLEHTLSAVRRLDYSEIGGWILFIDMILTCALFGFWEEAGRVGRSAKNRKP